MKYAPPQSSPKKPSTELRIWLRVFSMLRSQARTLAVGSAFLLVTSCCTLVYPQVLRRLIDQVLHGPTLEQVNRTSILFFAVFCLQAFTTSFRYYYFTLAGDRFFLNLQERLYSRILSQEIAYFDRTRTGDLMSRISSDSLILKNTVSLKMSSWLKSTIGVIGAFTLMLITSGKLTSIMLFAVPITIFGFRVFGRRIQALSREVQDNAAAVASISQETFSGIRAVQGFAQENYERERFSAAVNRTFRLTRRRILQTSLFMSIIYFAGFAAISVVFWAGSRAIVEGQVTMGVLTQFFVYLLIFAVSGIELGGNFSDLLASSGAARRIFDVLDREPEIRSTEGRRLPAVEGRIAFRGVSFSYPTRPGAPVLSDCDLEIEPNQALALIGPSGNGKSTIASLLLRFYDTDSGTIEIDGVDIRELEPAWLRTQIGYVPQEPVLISSTVEENIRYGNPAATDEQVREAAQLANAHDFIAAFPNGYQTVVGEKGVQISGGQKQRIAIARAILKDPRILIFDEATSALNPESEALVLEAMRKLMKGRTTLMIGHRLSNLKDADRIAALEGGRIVEMENSEKPPFRDSSVYAADQGGIGKWDFRN